MQVNDSSFDHNKGATLLEGESVSVVRSSFTSTDTQGEGALRVRSEGSPRVQDNVFTDTGSSDASSPCAHSFCDPTVAVASPKLDLGLLTGISGSGNVAASFGLGGTLIASGSLASLPSGWTPIIERAYGSLKVPSGVTLTVPAGTVVKSGGWPDFEAAVSVEGGSLVADGTVGAPVVFTWMSDGSVGGATSESSTPSRAPGAGWRCGMRPTSLEARRVVVGSSLKHARVSFAGVGVATAYNCGGNCNVPPAQLSSVLLDHVSVSRSQRGVSLGGVGRSSIGSVQVNDSSFLITTRARRCLRGSR